MVYTEKIKNHKKAVMISMFLFSILVHGVFFPIVNFNPNHPVDMGMGMRSLIIIMAVTFQKAIGALEAVVFEKWSMVLVGIFNCVLVVCGLFCRYLLEFGEVSNTYNFTVANVAFQMVVSVLVSMVVFAWESRKK